jgi:hypothetical protein
MAYHHSRVVWADLDPHTYERMVSVLLSHLHPDGKRIDGAGGDGGRDVYFPRAEGDEVFELKSFTGRMSPSQWRQVGRSLSRAAQRYPSSWHLVLPIDFTPHEEERFHKVASRYPFPCDYRGLTWLDGEMAEHPSIARYFLRGAHEEVIALLRELGREQAGLVTGLPDLSDRVRTLAARADEIDPHYRVSFSVDGEKFSFSLVPRYPGAEDDRPITITSSFAFPDTPEGRSKLEDLQDAIRYGATAIIPKPFIEDFAVDAPAGFGMSGIAGDLLVSAAAQSDLPPPDMRMALLDGADRQIASLPLPIHKVTRGIAGFEAFGADRTGCIKVRMRFDVPSRRMTGHYEISLPPACLPATALPTLRFLVALGVPNRLQLQFEDGRALTPATSLEKVPPLGSEYLDYVLMLDRVQAHTGAYFDLPANLTDVEYKALSDADRLIRGRSLRKTWTRFSVNAEVGGFVDGARTGGVDILAGENLAEWITDDYTLTIAGHTMILGPCTHILYSAMLDNLEEVRAAYADNPSQYLSLQFRPGASDDASMQLAVELPAPEATSPDRGSHGE